MKRFVLAAATAATMLVAGAAQAVTFTYATYTESGPWQSLEFVNNGGATPSGTLQRNSDPLFAGGLVNFKFFDDPNDAVVLPASLTNDELATIAFSANTSTAAVQDGFGGVSQIFDSGTISFTGAPGGPNAGLNLVTISFTKLRLTGNLGEDSATTLSGTPSSTMTITSNFFSFANATGSNFSLSMSAVVPSLSIGANGVLNGFTANSSGVFASNPAPTYVPEPGMLGLFGAGALGLAFARRRKS